MKDLYYILGTERNCTPAQLNTAYRTLADKLQPSGQAPDRFLDDHFREITDAYAILSDPVRRRRYDQAFRKSNQRMLRHFRTRYINIAVTLALLTFTGLFGMYVLKAINGRAAKKQPATKTDSVVAITHVKKSHKKHGYVKANPAAAIYRPPQTVNDDDDVQPIDAVNTNPPETPAAKAPAPAIVQPVAPVQKTTVESNSDEASSGYTTYLKANATGVVSLHSGASYRSAVVASIPNNAKVTVIDKGQGFARINFNGQTGYVPGWAVGQ